MLRRILATLAITILLGGGAHATVVEGAFTGVLSDGTRDTYGLFGVLGGNLSGATFSATYSYDTAAASFYATSPTFDDYLGTGGLTLSVTIGGVTVATTGVTNTEIVDTQDGRDTEVTLANFAPTPLLDFTLFVQGAWVPGVTIDAPFTLDPAWYGQTIYLSADGSHYDVLDFVGRSEPVPEPPSIVLLLAGTASIGCARRKWRKSAPPPAAG